MYTPIILPMPAGPKITCTSACFGSGNGLIFIKDNENCNILTSTCIRLAENNECDHSMDTGVICGKDK